MSQPQSLFDYPLDGPALIEASAGTGKTWTISGLVVRLVVETGLSIDKILVVTFTEAATEELRDRIRRRLRQVLDVLEGGDVDASDVFLVQAVAQWRPQPRAAERLRNALRGFDEAAVYTIHGFCQRVLAERAFASGMPFETTLLDNEDELVLAAVDDFWRREILTREPLLQDWILDAVDAPETLYRQVRSLLGKSYLACLGGEKLPDVGGFLAEAEQAYADFRTHWQTVCDELPAMLAKWPGKKGTSYKSNHVRTWLQSAADYVAGGQPLPVPENLERLTAEKMAEASNPPCELPQHPLFDAAARLVAIGRREKALREDLLLGLQRRLLDWLAEELPRRKREQRVQSFNDLLDNLDQALQGAQRDALVASVRDQYGAALIDEFQDTDPVQYRIFRALFMGEPALPLFLVGDPKQAIYGFRGADIFAYLAARGEIDNHLTLQHNWRSDPQLIQAVNALFQVDGHPRPFVFDDIPFEPALAPETGRKVLHDEQGGRQPLRLWPIPGGESRGKKKPLSKEAAAECLARACASEIARLLTDAQNGKVTLGKDPLRPGDIAVLVFSHRQAAQVQAALRELGVAAVLHSRESVFATEEAAELERLMLAFAEPQNPQLARAALAGRAWGLSADEVLALLEDDARWAEVQGRLQGYHEVWRSRGFMPAFSRFLFEQGVARRLLAAADGERRLTNILHLAELLQRRAAERHGGMESLIGWLAEQRRHADGDNEVAQLRLESDSERVQLVTMHKSKGLEYPLVFCPFLWNDVRENGGGESFVFHHPQQANRACADFGHPERGQHARWAQREALAELVRLAYVALTRARNRCYLAWGWVSGFQHSALAWLLHGAQADAHNAPQSLAEQLKGADDDSLQGWLQQLQARHPELMRVQALPEQGPLLAAPPPSTEHLQASRLARRIEQPWRISSFTGLSHGRPSEQPDYDAVPAPPALPEVEPQGIFAFPRGARAGTCLHAIFEHIDFADAADWDAVVESQLSAHGFDPGQWQAVVRGMLDEVLAAELQPGVRMERVTPDRRLVEMGFHFPVQGLTRARLSEVLARHGHESLAQGLGFDAVQGYLKGFIDLVFELDGRFYIVDYKSNYLGAQAEDYAGERLREAMLSARYPLQYLIYSLALHRYLRQRLPDYDYQRHFGGVFYLFLRGMQAQNGAGTGVWHDRPSAELIQALDALMGEDDD